MFQRFHTFPRGEGRYDHTSILRSGGTAKAVPPLRKIEVWDFFDSVEGRVKDTPVRRGGGIFLTAAPIKTSSREYVVAQATAGPGNRRTDRAPSGTVVRTGLPQYPAKQVTAGPGNRRTAGYRSSRGALARQTVKKRKGYA